MLEESTLTESGKNLKKLSRARLLELMIEQSREIESLAAELELSEAARAQAEAAYEELLKNQIDHTAENEEAVQRLMAGASQAAERVVAQGKLEADALLEQAQLKAEAIVREANEEAAVIRKYAKLLLSDAKGEASEL